MSATTQGRRLADTVIGQFPIDYDDLQPGDYWKVIHPKTGEPVKPTDGFWGDNPRGAEGNLTGTVWGVIDPAGRYGMLSIHTVREHEDGTISVRPGDGSSNSILISGGSQTTPTWHGYIDHGVWEAC